MKLILSYFNEHVASPSQVSGEVVLTELQGLYEDIFLADLNWLHPKNKSFIHNFLFDQDFLSDVSKQQALTCYLKEQFNDSDNVLIWSSNFGSKQKDNIESLNTFISFLKMAGIDVELLSISPKDSYKDILKIYKDLDRYVEPDKDLKVAEGSLLFEVISKNFAYSVVTAKAEMIIRKSVFTNLSIFVNSKRDLILSDGIKLCPSKSPELVDEELNRLFNM